MSSLNSPGSAEKLSNAGGPVSTIKLGLLVAKSIKSATGRSSLAGFPAKSFGDDWIEIMSMGLAS